jgi:hypothetical protein
MCICTTSNCRVRRVPASRPGLEPVRHQAREIYLPIRLAVPDTARLALGNLARRLSSWRLTLCEKRLNDGPIDAKDDLLTILLDVPLRIVNKDQGSMATKIAPIIPLGPAASSTTRLRDREAVHRRSYGEPTAHCRWQHLSRNDIEAARDHRPSKLFERKWWVKFGDNARDPI